MRRRIAVLSIAAAVVAAAPCAAFANVSTADQKSPKIVEKVTDPAGDVVAKTGTLDDLSSSGTAQDPFKPGHGTKVTPTADDEAIDLSKVTYAVVRTGAKPVLRITYAAKGPFSRADNSQTTDSTFISLESFDAFDTNFAKGYSVSIDNEAKKLDMELDNKAGKKQKCAGLTGTLTSGAHTATLSVPLSCLSAVGVKASPLGSESAHMSFSVVATDDNGTVNETDSVTVAYDSTAKSRDLPLTPYKK